jgi:hypothetical protein
MRVVDVPHSSPDVKEPFGMRRFDARASMRDCSRANDETTAACLAWRRGSRTLRSVWSSAWPLRAALEGERQLSVPSTGRSQ